MTFEDFGIRGVHASGAPVQRVLCPNCSPNSKTPTTCLTVWVKDGTWSCNKCGWGKGLSLNSNLKQWKEIQPKKEITYLSDKQLHWFETRGITKPVIERNKVGTCKHYFPQVEQEKQAVAFRYYVGETLVNVKYRDKDKNFTQETGADRTFFKINDILETDTCIITEGEIDALSFEVAGFSNAISVPDGAPNPTAKNVDTKMQFLEHSRRFFNHVKKIYLAVDIDAPGLKLREELARRLGKNKCWVVHFPDDCKDANEVLVKHGPERLAECLQQSVPYPIEGAYEAKDRFEYLNELYRNGFPHGARTSYDQFDEHFSFHPGQLTVITGIPSHGKSNFLDQITVRLSMLHGWRGALFTPENYPLEIHQMRIAEIFTRKPFLPSYNDRMNSNMFDIAKEFIQDTYFYIQPENERYSLDNILEIAEYFVQAKGINYLVLDPWNTIEHHIPNGETEISYQARTLNRLKYFARAMGIHVFLIAHPIKMAKLAGGRNYEIPNPYSISGSAHWYNVPDNAWCVYRYFHEDGTSDTQVYIQKVKHKFIGKIGMVQFKFDTASQSYAELNMTLRSPVSGERYDWF